MGWKKIEFWVQFASVSERLLVSFFTTIWRNIELFLRVDTVSKCFVHIWNWVHKKSEASEALSSWCFFRLNEVAIFLKFAIFFIKFFYLCNFWALKCPKLHITGHQNLLIEMRRNMQWIGRKNDKQFPYNRNLFRLFRDRRPFSDL